MKRRRIRGSLIVELALVLLIGGVFVAGTLSLTRSVLMRRRAYAAARLAAFLAASGVVSEATATAEAEGYWRAAGGSGPLRWRLSRFDKTAAARFYSLLEAEAQGTDRSGVPFRERVVVARED